MNAENYEGGAADPAGLDSHSAEFACLVALACDAWRLVRLSKRMLEKLDPIEGTRSGNQIRYLDRKIEDGLATAGVRLVNLEGQRFDAGMAASALNASDFEPTDSLVVEQMIEPVIIGRSGLIKAGVVMLAKVGP